MITTEATTGNELYASSHTRSLPVVQMKMLDFLNVVD